MTSKNEIIKKIERNWLFASKELNFEIACPYIFNYKNKEKKVFAYLPAYGSNKGMIIDLVFPPEFEIDTEITDWAKSNEYYYSFINTDRYLDYNEELFIETLEDWGRL